MPAPSTRWRPACCRSRSARRPRPCPGRWTARKTYRFTVRWGEARDDRRRRGRGHGASARAARRDAEIRSVTAALSPARSSRARRPSPPSRSTASAPMTWRAQASRPNSPPRPVDIHALRAARAGRRRPCRVRGRGRARAPICARWRATSARRSGTFGHVTALRRLAVGRFASKTAISLDNLDGLGHIAAASEHLLPIETALDDIPALAVTAGRGAPVALRPSRRSLRASGSRPAWLTRANGATVCATSGRQAGGARPRSTARRATAGARAEPLDREGVPRCRLRPSASKSSSRNTPKEGRYRFARSAGRDPVRADQEPDRALADPREGFPFAAAACWSWSASAGACSTI